MRPRIKAVCVVHSRLLKPLSLIISVTDKRRLPPTQYPRGSSINLNSGFAVAIPSLTFICYKIEIFMSIKTHAEDGHAKDEYTPYYNRKYCPGFVKAGFSSHIFPVPWHLPVFENFSISVDFALSGIKIMISPFFTATNAKFIFQFIVRYYSSHCCFLPQSLDFFGKNRQASRIKVSILISLFRPFQCIVNS